MKLDELRTKVDSGEIDTVLIALTDMQGRLQGKRLTARHFVEEVAEHGAEGCNYLLAVDVDMNTVDGYAMSSWELGYGDFEMHPDLTTLRLVPWQEATAMCLCDLAWADGRDVVASPRQVLSAQVARLAERGWSANASTELEFMVFRESYESAWHKAYRDLEPANLYNIDYSMIGTARIEPLIRRIRNSMETAEIPVENSKGECNYGQHEINFRYADVLRTADQHAIYKNAAKEIAADEGMAISYMAKFNEREGSSCHIHFSLADSEGMLFDRDRATFESFLAGQLACLRELTLLLAPNINSYKRYAVGSFAPTAVGAGQPHVRTARRRPRPRAAVREPCRRLGPEPLHGTECTDRGWPARSRPGARARARLQGQRLPGHRQATPARDAARGARPVHLERGGAWGVRGRGRRPLRARGRHRA